MKTKIVYLIACLLAVSTPILSAQDSTSRDEKRERLKNLTPEERQKLREKHGDTAVDPEKRREEMRKAAEEIGLNPDELRTMSPEERQKKVKEASDAKIAELTKKKTDGTITPEETKLLEKLEKRKKGMERAQEKGEGKPERREKSDKK